ncbi:MULTISPECIES: isochorismate family cysteine hydrolase YcaC [Psychrobacter]|uniref:Isochorismatase family protein n=2 Tax=Psychrobacter TaxID=497 RepID=A0A844M0X6_9GAMM|nr:MULTISPECIES: isochorismate family cysteine hydrolase YcaC [Psychrobacter]MUG32596.1 isochorismatase family protein [Psychrobacter sanguinis]
MFKPKKPKLKTDDNLYKRLSVDDAVVLFVDHQTGLQTLCRDMPADEFKKNVLAMGKIAKYFDLPVVMTTSFEQGPNGPMMPELKEMFKDAAYIARPGEINAWDNADFVKAVKKTGRKQIIIAGIVTEVCVAFPVLSALAEGYEVFVVTDASGTFNDMSRNAAWLRMQQEGAQLLTWFAMSNELRRDWREDMEGYLNLFYEISTEYAPLVDSYNAVKNANPKDLL